MASQATQIQELEQRVADRDAKVTRTQAVRLALLPPPFISLSLLVFDILIVFSAEFARHKGGHLTS